jgi:hypothetical protein
VIEQQNFHNGLETIEEKIVANNMCELVGKNGFEMCRRQTGEHAGREHDDWPQRAEHSGNSGARRLKNANETADA